MAAPRPPARRRPSASADGARAVRGDGCPRVRGPSGTRAAGDGESARKRHVESRSELTAQEAQVARLAREGLSNPEIGARLFISPRTVQYHLHKVFAKLGISSRAELQLALGTAEHEHQRAG